MAYVLPHVPARRFDLASVLVRLFSSHPKAAPVPEQLAEDLGLAGVDLKGVPLATSPDETAVDRARFRAG